MPTYEYQCSSCEHQFEEFQKITDEAISTCPECGAEEAKRLISASAFHLKGSGWYKTDYGSSNAASSSSASSNAAGSSSKSSSENKSDSKEKPAEKKSETKVESKKSDSKKADSKK